MYTIGIDLGGTNIVAGVLNENQDIISKASIKTNLPRGSNEIISDLGKAVFEALEKSGVSKEQIKYVGVGTPGAVDTNAGIVEYSCNLNFHNLPMAAELEKILNIPVYIENDANCAALGEQVKGAGKGASSFVAVTLGTGIGCGIVIDGKLVSGVNGTAGEVGHMSINPNGVKCTCQRLGCFEAYASATALISQTKAALNGDIEKRSIIWDLIGEDLDKISGKTAFDAKDKGDKLAEKIIDNYIGYLACGITNIVNIFQPEILCIGGGLCNQGDSLIEPLKEIVYKERYSIYSSKQTKIVRATLGNDAGVIGAGIIR